MMIVEIILVRIDHSSGALPNPPTTYVGQLTNLLFFSSIGKDVSGICQDFASFIHHRGPHCPIISPAATPFPWLHYGFLHVGKATRSCLHRVGNRCQCIGWLEVLEATKFHGAREDTRWWLGVDCNWRPHITYHSCYIPLANSR